MIREKKEKIQWLTFEILNPLPLAHRTYTRRHIDFSQPKIKKNTFFANQVHGTHIQKITKDSPPIIDSCDGLMTDVPFKTLVIRHADCQAAIFYDKKHHAVANVHAGWKGLVEKIYLKTIQKMQNSYLTDPKDLIVAISPSLGPLASEFVNYKTEFPAYFQRFQVKPNYFNLWEIAKDQLIQAGVQSKHIQIASLCTFSNQKDFYSYRRDKTKKRQATVVSLL